jgi:hypothetical protein
VNVILIIDSIPLVSHTLPRVTNVDNIVVNGTIDVSLERNNRSMNQLKKWYTRRSFIGQRSEQCGHVFQSEMSGGD